MRFIQLDKEKRKTIAMQFGVAEKVVWYALRVNVTENTAEQTLAIRKKALEMGGVETVVTPTSKILQDTGYSLVQSFPNGALIEIEKNTGNLTLSHNDRILSVVEQATVEDFTRLQKKAKTL